MGGCKDEESMRKKKPVRMRKIYYADGHVGYRPILTRQQYLSKVRKVRHK